MATFSDSIAEKLPTREQVLPVFSVITFIVYTWTLYRMFWYIPSWLGDFKIMEVLTICTYVLVFALFESTVILGILLMFAFLLPRRVFLDSFVPTGSALITIIAFCAFLLQRKMKIIYKLELWQLILYPFLVLTVILVLIFVLTWLFNRFEPLKKFVYSIAERMPVFLFIYIPVSIFGVVFILLRSIL